MPCELVVGQPAAWTSLALPGAASSAASPAAAGRAPARPDAALQCFWHAAVPSLWTDCEPAMAPGCESAVSLCPVPEGLAGRASTLAAGPSLRDSGEAFSAEGARARKGSPDGSSDCGRSPGLIQDGHGSVTAGSGAGNDERQRWRSMAIDESMLSDAQHGAWRLPTGSDTYFWPRLAGPSGPSLVPGSRPGRLAGHRTAIGPPGRPVA